MESAWFVDPAVQPSSADSKPNGPATVLVPVAAGGAPVAGWQPGAETTGGLWSGVVNRNVHTPRPYVATTARFGSFGLRLTVLIGTMGRPVRTENFAPPF